MSQKILIVENDKRTRELVLSALTSSEFECQSASDEVAAFTLLDSGSKFEAVLLCLPGPTLLERIGLKYSKKLNGRKLLEHVNSRNPDIPVILLADRRNLTAALLAVRSGAFGYILKPFDPEDLLIVIRRALENRRLKPKNRDSRSELEGLDTARTDQVRQALSTLERSYNVTLEGLRIPLDLSQAEPEGHSKRVTAFALAIARAMAIPEDQIRVIGRGAFLHDIGKVAIPDALLLKPGSLDSDEMAIMREHCFRGYQIVSRIPFLAGAAEIVFCHHENYDGTGYPRCLKGDEIPLGARITAGANTLDAITTDRPYQTARTFAEARAEIERWSERQFDPRVVQVFLAMGENIWQDLRKGL